MIEIFLPERKKVQRTEAIRAATNPELRKIVAGLLLSAAVWPSAWASTATALRKYEAGDYKDSHQEYLRLLNRKPDDLRLQYNAGAAAYQAKKFDEAVKHFSTAAAAQDLSLQEHAYYNLGDSHYRLGEAEPDPTKRTEAWEQSVKEYAAALKLDPLDQDAKFNLDFVKNKLEELKKQQNQSQKQSPDKNKESKDQNQDQPQNQDRQDKQSQSKPDQKEQDKKPQDQNKPEQNQDNKGDQKQQQQSQSPQPKPKAEDKGQGKEDGAPKPEQRKVEGSPTNATASSSSALPGQMTPEQVKQLLDSQKDNEKAMIFIPPEKLNSRKRAIKDW